MPLSYSQLQQYRRCPRQYEFAVIKGVKRPISPGESFGASMHNTLKKWGELELGAQGTIQDIDHEQISLLPEDHHHGNAPRPLTLATLRTLWRESLIGEGYGSHAEADMALMRGDALLQEFFARWQREPRSVLAVEKSFRLPLHDPSHPELIVSGRFDRIERSAQGLVIIDFKTTAPPKPEKLTTDLQLSIYALAAGYIWQEPVASLSLLCMTEDEGVIEHRTTRSPSELKDAVTMIRLLAAQITAADYKPTPSVSVCRHCPYREMCDVRAV